MGENRTRAEDRAINGFPDRSKKLHPDLYRHLGALGASERSGASAATLRLVGEHQLGTVRWSYRYMPDRSREEIGWTVISFFASESEVQRNYVGETDLTFFPPGEEVSRSANFLVAIHFLFILHRNAFSDVFDLPEDTVIEELREEFKYMFWFKERALWEPSQLEVHPVWCEVRGLARQVLAEAGLCVEYPLSALDVERDAEEFIWTEGPEI